MNWQPGQNGQANPGMGSVAPVTTSRPSTKTTDPAGDWLCAWCLHRVANERDRFQVEGKDEFAFTNPAGICFEIITFEQAPGCEQYGAPTFENTWFPGHAWSYCQCDQCGQHLGWYYSGPDEFVGLIKDRVVRALFVRN